MRGVNELNPSSSSRVLGLNPTVAGTICCVISALGYTASNICMRRLSTPEFDCDPAWIIFNKELVTVVIVGPWLLARTVRRMPTWPSLRALAALVLVGLCVQLVANLGVQWALGIVGLAVTIPAIFGVMLTASAVLGRILLGERVSMRSAGAIALLIVALVLLGLSANAAGRSIAASGQTAPGPLLVALALAAGCMAGAVYAVLTITIRRAVTGSAHFTAVVFVITGMGVLSLGPISAGRLGIDTLAATPPDHFAWMLAAGTFNLIAFVAITKGLQLTTVVHANVLNASQVAMAAIAGLMIFDEPPNSWMILGVCLTVAGVMLIDRPVDGNRGADQHA